MFPDGTLVGVSAGALGHNSLFGALERKHALIFFPLFSRDLRGKRVSLWIKTEGACAERGHLLMPLHLCALTESL